MDLFNLHRLFLSIVSGRIQPPGHPPNLSKNLVLVNCKSTVLALFLIVYPMNAFYYTQKESL